MMLLRLLRGGQVTLPAEVRPKRNIGTRDKDLLSVAAYHGIRTATPRQFLDLLEVWAPVSENQQR